MTTARLCYIFVIQFIQWKKVERCYPYLCSIPTPCFSTSRLFLLQSGPVHTLTPITPAPHTLQTAVSNYTNERIPQEPSYQAPNDRLFYLTHNCSPECLKRIRPTRPNLHRGRNPLLTPLLYEFRRMTGRRRLNRKVCKNKGAVHDPILILGVTI